MNKNLLAIICDIQCSGDKAALVTIINTKGSTPRKAGSKMLIWPDGKTVGTIGGGCAEAEVRLKTLQAFDDSQSFMYRVDMLNDIAAQEGMVCGGVMDVFIQLL